MGYIRSNEDYYVSTGYSPEQAKVEAEMDRRSCDLGFCNPIKAKMYEEERKDVEKQIKEEE